MIYTYVLKSRKDGKWYTGFTHNLRERFKQHNNNEVFSTKSRGPFDLIYYEACSSEYDATMREKYLKSGMGKRYLKNRLKRSLSLTGFTIIELIIVIAIIAVLSGIVIANVIPYNSKGKDSAIKEQIGQIRIAGTDYFNTYGSYIGMCDSGTGCFNAKSNIINLGGYVLSPRIASDKYCYDFKLSDNATKWCVDSMGYNGSIDNCTLLNFSCN